MENDDDPKLRELLSAWRVPEVPGSLDERVRALRRSRWMFLFTGSIRVPVPVGLAIAVALLIMAGAMLKQKVSPDPVVPSVNLLDFRPVADVNVRVIRQNDYR